MQTNGWSDWLQRLADFEWDFSEIIAWLQSTVMFWVDSLGIFAWVIVVLVVIFIGLSMDLTHHMTSLIVAGAVKGVIYALLTAALGVLAIGGRWVGATSLASARNSLKFTRNRYRFAKAAGEKEE